MEYQFAKEIFEKLYENVNGRALSLEGREEQQFTSKSFVYGEAVFDHFYQLLKEANPQPGQVFLDCGSGTGKAVFIAGLCYDFAKAAGVELVDKLYSAAQSVADRFDQEFKPKYPEELGNKNIFFVHGSMVDIDFSTVDIVFMNSTCFQEDLMAAVEGALAAMKPDGIVITLSKTLRTPLFHQYKNKMFEFSWGQATAFYHRRLAWTAVSSHK